LIKIPADSDFSIHNIPFGIFSTANTSPRVGVAIGDFIIDLERLASFDAFGFDTEVFSKNTLNQFIGLGKAITRKVRTDIQGWLRDEHSVLGSSPDLFIAQQDATMHLPLQIGDYTDFYSSLDHATNVGKMFRDPENALLPNWKHMPVAYHGRASSIVVSGTDIHRPKGQVMKKGRGTPQVQPSERLDFELEMACVIGKENRLGHSISTAHAQDYIFGMVLFNDWSARDIQKWEYVPLGPFLGKNFASSISPWVVTIEALDAFRVKGYDQNPPVQEYLKFEGSHYYDINLEVSLAPENCRPTTVVRSNFRHMYWNMLQQIAHHTVSGCNLKVGDLLASGTISGPDQESFGSMLELSWGGTRSLILQEGGERTFIEDYDTVAMHGYGEQDGKRVGFGQVTTKILPVL